MGGGEYTQTKFRGLQTHRIIYEKLLKHNKPRRKVYSKFRGLQKCRVILEKLLNHNKPHTIKLPRRYKTNH